MNRIQKLFSKPKEKVIPFVTAGYPNKNSTVNLVLEMAKAGADMIEIGIPFSDPQADGPIIQYSSEIALKNKINIEFIFSQISTIRKKTNIPIALFSYFNPILQYGEEKFLNDCLKHGVDGIILPDLPLEESKNFCKNALILNLSPILLVAPNTSDERIKTISKTANHLIYAVTILGITGGKLSSNIEISNYLNRVRKNSTSPFIVGFGISSRKDVIWFNQYSDGAVVGSACIKKIKNNNDPEFTINQYVKELKGKL